jgi:hypothetical protein
MSKIVLDLDEVESEFSDLALLIFRTNVAGYIFTDSINRLYRLAFHRVDDLEIDGLCCPLYTYLSEEEHLKYFLIEHPLSSTLKEAWRPGDKILIVRGSDALKKVESIHSEFTGKRQPQPDDLVAVEHNNLLEELLEQFTVTSIINLEAPYEDIPPKAAKERRQMEKRCLSILKKIEELNLDLTEEELRWLNR